MAEYEMVPASDSEPGSMPILSLRTRAWKVKTTILAPFHSLALLVIKGQS
jgi:hypothetical protein